MKIFISGMPKTGKTTLVKRIVEEFKDYFIGFWTEEIKGNKKRIGFKIVSTWGESETLAHIDFRTNYRVGKYFVRPEVLDKFVEKLESENLYKKIIVIDEAGKMEFYSKKFEKFFKNILKDEKIDLLAVVHRNYLHLVPHYYWLEIGKWWDIYKKVRQDIRNLIKEIREGDAHHISEA